jgi:hypothetical protein
MLTKTKKTVLGSKKKIVKAVPAKPAAKATGKTKSGKAAPVKTGAFGRPVVPGAKKKASAKPKVKKLVFKASDDVKSAFIEVGFKAAKDGIIGRGATVEYIKGNPTNENAPRYDLVIHDPDTALTLVSRINMRLFAANAAKRLTPGRDYSVLVRLTVSKAKGNEIRTSIKEVWMSNAKGTLEQIDTKLKKFAPTITTVKGDDGTKKQKKTYCQEVIESRKIRSAGRFLMGAFVGSIGPVDLKALDKAYQLSLDQEEADDDADE